MWISVGFLLVSGSVYAGSTLKLTSTHCRIEEILLKKNNTYRRANENAERNPPRDRNEDRSNRLTFGGLNNRIPKHNILFVPQEHPTLIPSSLSSKRVGSAAKGVMLAEPDKISMEIDEKWERRIELSARKKLRNVQGGEKGIQSLVSTAYPEGRRE